MRGGAPPMGVADTFRALDALRSVVDGACHAWSALCRTCIDHGAPSVSSACLHTPPLSPASPLPSEGASSLPPVCVVPKPAAVGVSRLGLVTLRRGAHLPSADARGQQHRGRHRTGMGHPSSRRCPSCRDAAVHGRPMEALPELSLVKQLRSWAGQLQVEVTTTGQRTAHVINQLHDYSNDYVDTLLNVYGGFLAVKSGGGETSAGILDFPTGHDGSFATLSKCPTCKNAHIKRSSAAPRPAALSVCESEFLATTMPRRVPTAEHTTLCGGRR